MTARRHDLLDLDLAGETLRAYAGPTLLALIQDDTISEIYSNPDGRLRTDGRGGRRLLDASLNPHDFASFCRSLAVAAGVVLDPDHPIADFKLPLSLGGGRLHVKIQPVVDGISFNLRKTARRLFLLDELVAKGSVSPETAVFLRELLSLRRSILIAGPTNSGKTSLLSALLHELVTIHPEDRYMVLEDVPEIHCPASDTLYCRTTPNTTLWDLTRAALRSTPDVIVVGEIRGSEAYPYLDVASTGHGGGYATIHAETPDGALERLNRLARLHNPEAPDQGHLIASVVRVVLCLTGGSKGRRVSQVAQVLGWSSQGFRLANPLRAYPDLAERSRS